MSWNLVSSKNLTLMLKIAYQLFLLHFHMKLNVISTTKMRIYLLPLRNEPDNESKNPYIFFAYSVYEHFSPSHRTFLVSLNNVTIAISINTFEALLSEKM